MYNSASTIYQGVKANTDAKVLKAKLALNGTGPYKVLAVGPCSSAGTPDISPIGDNLLYLDLVSDFPCSDARRLVALERCKPCDKPHGSRDMPKYLPTGLIQYVLNNVSKKLHRTTSPKTTFPLPFRARSGAHWPPLGPWARWSHRGNVQDALGKTLRTIVGAEVDLQLSRTPLCVIEPALRTSLAKQTDSTAECALLRQSVSFPGKTSNAFWRPAALASHARSGFAATATRWSPKEPMFGERATMG